MLFHIYFCLTVCQGKQYPEDKQLNVLFFLFRASGKILKAYAQDFEALSKDGHLFVVVQNTGYVTADFAVSATLMDTVPIPSVF